MKSITQHLKLIAVLAIGFVALALINAFATRQNSEIVQKDGNSKKSNLPQPKDFFETKNNSFANTIGIPVAHADTPHGGCSPCPGGPSPSPGPSPAPASGGAPPG